jgi:hypothetical protein
MDFDAYAHEDARRRFEFALSFLISTRDLRS